MRLRPNWNRPPNFDVRGFSHETRGTRFLLKIPGHFDLGSDGASPYQRIVNFCKCPNRIHFAGVGNVKAKSSVPAQTRIRRRRYGGCDQFLGTENDMTGSGVFRWLALPKSSVGYLQFLYG